MQYLKVKTKNFGRKTRQGEKISGVVLRKYKGKIKKKNVSFRKAKSLPKKCKTAKNAGLCTAPKQDPYRIEIEFDYIIESFASVTMSKGGDPFFKLFFGETQAVKTHDAAVEIVEFVKSKIQP